jgi:NDP-sugar pyrophosphorylase family protein
METTWNFRVGKTKKLISELYTEEEVETLLNDTLENYTEHMNSDDFVIGSIDVLLDEDYFNILCRRFDLIFNENEYNKVKEFLETT